MDNHHLKLNPVKTELIFFPALNTPFSDFSISLGEATVTSFPSARNLGVLMDSRLSLSENITAVTRTCRFFLNNIRRICPFLTTYSTQHLVQAIVLSRLDYCNSLLAGLLASAIRPLQLIQNAAARLIFNVPRYTHTPPRCSLTSTGCLLWLASNSRHWYLHTRQSRDQPPLTSNSSSDPTHLPDLYAPLPLDVWCPPPVTPAHNCSLFWPHDGGMTFL